ncbi:transaminase [Dermatobacter hominis]|uniref:transaminase n=1 Tax=Dermatobacter hominis TaxID=2884263 RepID=UPI001D11F14C|nr:transaminase [Dermatobacter hominis]UDY35552.1 aminotransferase class III-fold pyridoxal phosphate-dependent enzyme [Dermatobacter hominis]
MAGPTVDRGRLEGLMAAERELFVRRTPRSAELHEQARRSLLAGVPMSWMTRWPGPHPVFVDEASGARFTDADGNTYIDLCLGDTGAMTGHSLPATVRALEQQAPRGITTMLPSPDAIAVGDELRSRFGLPVWQIAMTATDANRFALRIARHATGRKKVLVFDWCYHGTVDEALNVLADDGRVVPRPGNTGWATDPSLSVEVVQFNDVEALERVLATGEVAAVLAEPALTNIGIVPPEPGFHDALRRITRETGTVLIIDETHTICCGPGGATREWGLEPDMFVIGKPIGGGVPCAAYGMTEELAGRVLEVVEGPDSDVAGIGGTLTANALALAAVRATLGAALREEDFAVAVPLAHAWADGVQGVIDEHGLPWTVNRLGCRAEYWFCPAPRNGAEAAAAVDHELDAFLHLWCLNRGILLTPFHNMALFCPAHTASDVEHHTAVFGEAVAALVA